MSKPLCRDNEITPTELRIVASQLSAMARGRRGADERDIYIRARKIGQALRAIADEPQPVGAEHYADIIGCRDVDIDL